MNKFLFATIVFLLWLFLIASSASAQWTVEWIDIDDAHGAGQSLEVDVEIIGTTANVTANRPCPASPRGETGVAEIWFNCGANNDTVIRPGGIIYSRSECGTKTYQITLPYLCGPTPCTTGVISDGDLDDDGVPDCVDNDIDGDKVLNSEDPDIDGDDIPNELDCDIDSDGTLNINDDDIDGDHLLNGDDPDMDGDQIPNVGDDNPSGDVDYDNGLVPQPQGGFGQPGDGKPNCPCVDENSNFDDDEFPNHEDGNIDADNDHNCNDDDVDGDGIPNDEDPDDDGDCILDEEDITPQGRGCQADDDDDGIPNACDVDTGHCADLTGPQGNPDGICDRLECEPYKDNDGDEIPNICDADWEESDCNDENNDGICDEATCSEWNDAGEADDDGDGTENKCDKYPTPTTVNPCHDRNRDEICDGCQDSDPSDPREEDYDGDEVPDICDANCGGPGCGVRSDCIDADNNQICDDCDEDGTVPQCENPREDCPDYDCDYICDDCDADCGGPGCSVRSDCIDEEGPEDKPDGVCDDCVGGSFDGGGSYGDGDDDGECEDVDGDKICDDCDAMINGQTIREDCLDANSNGTCDDCEADKCPDYDDDGVCDECDYEGTPGGVRREDCFDEDGDKICDDCQLNCFETLSTLFTSFVSWTEVGQNCEDISYRIDLGYLPDWVVPSGGIDIEFNTCFQDMHDSAFTNTILFIRRVLVWYLSFHFALAYLELFFSW